VEPRRAEQEIEVPEGIEVAEEVAIVRDPRVIAPVEHLRAAERILDGLLEKPREGEAEELVSQQVKEAHGLTLYGIDEPHAVDELALAGHERAIELGQILRRDRQIGVEDHQDVVPGRCEAFAHGVALALAVALIDERELEWALVLANDRFD